MIDCYWDFKSSQSNLIAGYSGILSQVGNYGLCPDNNLSLLLLGDGQTADLKRKASFAVRPDGTRVLQSQKKPFQTGVSSETTLALHQWDHIAAVYDYSSQTIAIYHNQALTKASSLSEGVHMQLGPTKCLEIGGAQTKVDMLHGRVADVGIWNRALPFEDIKALSLHRPASISPVAFWPLNDGPSSKVAKNTQSDGQNFHTKWVQVEFPSKKATKRGVELPSERVSSSSFRLSASSLQATSSHQLKELQLEVDMVESNLLGRGGYGAVYKARMGERWVAVKNLWMLETPEIYGIIRDSPTHRSIVEEFVKEANILASIRHPNIVEFLGIVPTQAERSGGSEIDMVPKWIVTELAETTLLKKIETAPDQSLSFEVASRYMSQVLAGLSFLHSRSIVHRDIKPANILLFSGEVVKLCDLGVARHIERHETLTMTRVGTPLYVAPEVLSGRYQMSADIYSVGITFAEMLTGTALPAASAAARLDLLRELSLSPLFSAIPAAVFQLILQCIDPSPSVRPLTADIVNNLNRITGSGSAALEPTSLVAPTPILAATTFHLASWLQSLTPPLTQYLDNFVSNDCDQLEVLKSLTDEDLKQIGISSLGHRRIILLARDRLT